MKEKIADQGIIQEKCSGPSTRFPEKGGLSQSHLEKGYQKHEVNESRDHMHPLKKA